MDNKYTPPPVEQLNNLTFAEFTEFLTDKNVGIKCKECNSDDQSINGIPSKEIIDKIHLSVSSTSIKNGHKPEISYSYYTIVCNNCYSTRFFNAVHVSNYILQQKTEQNSDDTINNDNGDA